MSFFSSILCSLLIIFECRFKLGLKVAERGLKIVADKGNKLTKYTWPGTQIEFEYGTLEYLKVTIL